MVDVFNLGGRMRRIGMMTLLSVPSLLLAILLPVQAQVSGANRQFVSRACGFQVEFPADWKLRPSRSKRCAFTVMVPTRADLDIELIVRHGTLDDNQLGFTKEDGKWILQGEGSAAAAQIESANWVGLQGSVGSRIYEKGFYRGFGDQTRALLFDRKDRIAEVTSFSGAEVVPAFVKRFEFLGASLR
jgi:hypothetical protein